MYDAVHYIYKALGWAKPCSAVIATLPPAPTAAITPKESVSSEEVDILLQLYMKLQGI